MAGRADRAEAVLTVNSGSSSLKIAVFDAAGAERLRGSVSEIGGAARLVLGPRSATAPIATHRQALEALLDAIDAEGGALSGVAASVHRVVHGGRSLTETARLTPGVRAAIEACAEIAPLHNPPALAAIDALAELRPDLVHYACFDTAFHVTIPDLARRYALPATPETDGICRYGFHGISYASLVRLLPEISGAPLPGRLLALHLGNGASLCAISEGRSAATTMGYSPLEGLTMGTRAGSIDGNAVLKLAERLGIDGAARLLNRESGLLGLGGASDMRQLAEAETEEARFAIAHFCYWAARHAGSMIVAMGGCDALAFTGGIGENRAEVRAAIAEALSFLGLDLCPEANRAGAARLHSANSRIGAWIVPAREEAMMAEEVLAALAAGR